MAERLGKKLWCTLAPTVVCPRSRRSGRRLPLGTREAVMNEDTFNIQVRKFLKEVDVTSQREIGAGLVGAGRPAWS